MDSTSARLWALLFAKRSKSTVWRRGGWLMLPLEALSLLRQGNRPSDARCSESSSLSPSSECFCWELAFWWGETTVLWRNSSRMPSWVSRIEIWGISSLHCMDTTSTCSSFQESRIVSLIGCQGAVRTSSTLFLTSACTDLSSSTKFSPGRNGDALFVEKRDARSWIHYTPSSTFDVRGWWALMTTSAWLGWKCLRKKLTWGSLAAVYPSENSIAVGPLLLGSEVLL